MIFIFKRIYYMGTQLNNTLTFSGPKDKSIGAYKDWIMSIAVFTNLSIKHCRRGGVL
jgi:hypothetical protein